ncbi:ROK family transcriptional regulator [Enterococcus sp. DIV1298c]|uniref:HTH marR-type domain-containing protein n=1 Tax=Candidatus Enterococcus mangumiae TaxID=2230878 RepID=A0ABZ2SWM0_9ENTE|nr:MULTISPECIES: ROK family transcriptional regulator [unclassified Enterococcus]MBO0461724.1 ROK family transcriptional regulator [Enterococcus sp. DIV1298c]MBO0488565.1 ROK family transcriptional regulator [Enterococcus sp. DIV1094]
MKNPIYTRRSPNESLCLELIMNHPALSRAELSAKTGLTKATVSAIVKKLIDDHLVIETGIGESSNVGGRKPIILQYNGKAGLSIAIDIGYNYINGLLTYLDGEEVQHIKKKPITLDEEAIDRYLSEIFTLFEQQMPTTEYGIIGVAIAVHGPVYHGEPIFGPHYNFDHIPFRKIAEKLRNYPVYLENEANLAALGEYTFTSDSKNLVSINMHSGIGAGIVKNGNLEVGAHGFAGEIGHQIIVMDGKACRCGNRGCLEMYAANKVCYEQFAQRKKLDYVNAIILREYYQNQDHDAREVVEENINYLTIGINNLIAHYDPSIIVLNSSLYREIPDMIEQLRGNLRNHFSNQLVVRNSSLNEKATLLGGVVLNLQHFLGIKHLKLK